MVKKKAERTESNRKKTKQYLQRPAEELRALNSLSRRLNGALSLDEIVKITFEEISNCIALDFALLFLMNGEELALQAIQTRSPDIHYKGSHIKQIGNCLCGLAVSQGKSQYSKDIHSDARCAIDDYKKSGMHSFAALTLFRGEIIIGVLGIATIREHDFLQEAVFLEAAAGSISITIQCVLQQKELERHATDLEEQAGERLRAEQAQIAIEERQSAIIRTMQLILYCAETPSPFSATWMTENVEQVTGFHVKLFLEEPGFWSSRIHPDDSSRIEHAFELIRSKKTMDLEYRWRCADGAYRWFLDRIVSIQKEYRGRVEYFGIWLDITDRKRQEEALRRSEERFRALFEQAAVGVAQIDTASGRYLRVNRKFCDIVGYTRKELEELDVQSITYSEDLLKDVYDMKSLISGKIREFTVEKRYKHSNGRIVWVSQTISPLWSPGAPPVSHIAVMQDITERKRAEEALEISEVRYRRLFETANEGILILDADTGQICDTNPCMEKMFGYTRSELTGKALWEIGLFNDTDSGIAFFQELKTKEYLRFDNLPLKNKAGESMNTEFISSTYLVEDWKVIQCNIRQLAECK